MEGDFVLTTDICAVSDCGWCTDYCESECSLMGVSYFERYLSRCPQRMKKGGDPGPWNGSSLLVDRLDFSSTAGVVRYRENQSCNLWTGVDFVHSIRPFSATCVYRKITTSILIGVFVGLKYKHQLRATCLYAPTLLSFPGTLSALSQLNMTPTSQATMFI